MSTFDNQDALETFVQRNHLNKSTGYANFKGHVEIDTEKNSFEGNENIRICFTSMSSGNVDIVIDKSFKVKKFPSDFWINSAVYKCVDKTLVITGKHPSPNIGKYTCKITVS